MKIQSTFLACLLVAVSFFGCATLNAQKLDSFPPIIKPTWDIEGGAINDSWGGGFARINDDGRTFGIYLIFDQSSHYGVRSNYSLITNKNYEDSTQGSRLDELWLEGYYNLLRSKGGWFNAGILGGLVVSGNLGGQKFQESTHTLLGVPSVILPYANLSKTFALTGFQMFTDPIRMGGREKMFYAFSPSMKVVYAPNYQLMLDARFAIGSYSYHLSKLTIEMFYRYTEDLTGQLVMNKLAAKESGFGFGFNRRVGGTRLFWNAYLQSDYSVGGLALYIQNKTERKPFQKADVILEFGAFAQGLDFYNKYHWNDTKLWNDHLRFSFQHFYGAYDADHLDSYPAVNGHYSQTELGAYVQFLKERPKLQLNPKVGLNAAFKKESYYAGSDLSVPPYLAMGLVFHGEAGAILSFPLPFLAENTLYGVCLMYNYNFSPGEKQVLLNGKPATVLANYGWISAGFVVQLDL
ncbi:MAG: hypothetical protein KDC83_07235 [Flavobacteriales bacterium]|nr:hypothetical protein [Flavobacteriales bacterium]